MTGGAFFAPAFGPDVPVRKESMRVLRGKYTSALILSDSAEDYAIAQIQQLIDQPSMAGSKMRIMPDVHPGKIGPIGLRIGTDTYDNTR